MKRLARYLSVLAGLGLFVLPVLPAQAHVLRQDNGVSAVLHIAPFDAPVSGEPTRLEIEFSNAASQFSLRDYVVKLQVGETGSAVMKYSVEPAYFGTATEGLATVTFPRADVYHVQLRGTPIHNQAPGFTMEYDVRVTAGEATAGPKQGNQIEVLAIGLVILVLLGMVAVQQILSGTRYKQSSNK